MYLCVCVYFVCVCVLVSSVDGIVSGVDVCGSVCIVWCVVFLYRYCVGKGFRSDWS